MFPSYRNQPVDLESKSTDWFLYDGNIGQEYIFCSTPKNGCFRTLTQRSKYVQH